MGGSRLNNRTAVLLTVITFCCASLLAIPNSMITWIVPFYGGDVPCTGLAVTNGTIDCSGGNSTCIGESICSGGDVFCTGNVTYFNETLYGQNSVYDIDSKITCHGNSTCMNGVSSCVGLGTCQGVSKSVESSMNITCNGGVYEREILWWRLTGDPPFGDAATTKAIVTFLVYPCFGKVIPVVLISIFGGLLLRTLYETDKRGRRLKGDNSASHAQNRRTTVMLLAIIVMYIISEVPQSVLVILSLCVRDFWKDVYGPLGDLIDLLALINSATNFIMYCTMSRQFRTCLTESVNECAKSLSNCLKKKDDRLSGETTLTHV